MGVAIFAQWISNATVAFTFPILISALGSNPFLILAVINVATFVFLVKYHPETRGPALVNLSLLPPGELVRAGEWKKPADRVAGPDLAVTSVDSFLLPLEPTGFPRSGVRRTRTKSLVRRLLSTSVGGSRAGVEWEFRAEQLFLMTDARAGGRSHARRAVRQSTRQLRAEVVGRAVLREKLLEGLRGRVIEIGAGQGLNFIHYPPGVAELLAVEPDDVLREFAAGAARVARIPVDVVAGEATALPAADASRDAAVVSLLLCTVPSPERVLAEVRRCLRPGGELRFYEHVRAPGRVAPYVQDAATPLWMRCFRGCHPNRDAESAIRRAGFDIVEIERFNVGTTPLNPAAPHILGRAIRG